MSFFGEQETAAPRFPAEDENGSRYVTGAADDPNYVSPVALGRHVLGAAGGYLVWTCEVLRLPGPGIRPAPDANAIVRTADEYLEHVLDRWRGEAFRGISGDQLETPEYPSSWKTRYSIDSMLEYAVMHPIRHAFQLDELMKNR